MRDNLFVVQESYRKPTGVLQETSRSLGGNQQKPILTGNLQEPYTEPAGALQEAQSVDAVKSQNTQLFREFLYILPPS